jgi:uncharacterized membrane-anchored protein
LVLCGIWFVVTIVSTILATSLYKNHLGGSSVIVLWMGAIAMVLSIIVIGVSTRASDDGLRINRESRLWKFFVPRGRGERRDK